jgi:hypothetical protein
MCQCCGIGTLPSSLRRAGRATPIDRWVADLMDMPEEKRTQSLYELCLRLNLRMSHLEDADETYARRLGLR